MTYVLFDVHDHTGCAPHTCKFNGIQSALSLVDFFLKVTYLKCLIDNCSGVGIHDISYIQITFSILDNYIYMTVFVNIEYFIRWPN